jgi:hypothetical protein
MKKFAWFCVILACAALALAAAYIFSSRLNVVSEVRVVPAAYMQKDFDELLASGAVSGDAGEYWFVLVRADIKSRSPFSAEWITLTLDKQSGDGAALASNAGPKDLEAFGALAGDDAMYLTVLTRSPDENRRTRLEYYIHGRYHVIELQ